jgi:hypothetical protein
MDKLSTQEIAIHCLYDQLDNGIHEYVIRHPTRAAVDEWFQHAERVYENAAPDIVLRHLVDSRSGSVPLAYAFQVAQAFFRVHKTRPSARIALLNDEGSISSLVSSFTSLLPTDRRERVRMFTEEQRDMAIAWLLADD